MTTSGTGAPEPSPGSGMGAEFQHLACGADVDELLEQVADGDADELTAHQSGCEYCHAALTEFTALWSPVALAAAAPFVVPAGLAGSLTAAVMADVAKLPTTATPPSASGGVPLKQWLPQVIAAVVLAAIIAMIVLVSRHHGSKTSGTVPVGIVASSSVAAPTTTAPSAPASRPAAPASRPAATATSSAPARAIPTAVPAGSGGQAAATTTGTRDEQLALLLAGVVLIAVGGYLVRRRR